MRRIAHLSDLHFGRTDPAVLEDLKRAVMVTRPDMVVVSGDLTQRARTAEFRQARDFLAALPKPQIVVPGNHDVPLYNVFKRGLTPLSRFTRYIGKQLSPFYADGEVAVLGINTARAFSLKSGRINRSQVKKACANFGPLPASVIRVVVTHHPFAVPESGTHRTIVGRAKMAMEAFGDCKVDIVLSGHLHVSQAITSETLYAGPHAALLVQAGTASSTRRREETNAFNLLRLDGLRVDVERHDWEDGGFIVACRQRFQRRPTGWVQQTKAA